MSFLLLCKFCSRWSICNDGLLVQGTIHILIGEHRWVSCVVSHKFSPYIPIVLMVCVQNCVWRLPVHMLRFQDWVNITAICWVSWWIWERGGPISRRGRDIPHYIGCEWSDYWIFSLPVQSHLSDACVVSSVGTVRLILQNIFLGPLIIHFPLCLVLVLIPDFSICHELLLSH